MEPMGRALISVGTAEAEAQLTELKGPRYRYGEYFPKHNSNF